MAQLRNFFCGRIEQSRRSQFSSVTDKQYRDDPEAKKRTIVSRFRLPFHEPV
jgi:hypothetical protein